MRETRPEALGTAPHVTAAVAILLASTLLLSGLLAASTDSGTGSRPAAGPPRVFAVQAAPAPSRIAALSVNATVSGNGSTPMIQNVLSLDSAMLGGQGWDLGDGMWHSTTGITNFTSAASDPDYPEITILLTNGINNTLDMGAHVPNGGGTVSGGTESYWLGRNPDLLGYSVDFIRFVVHTMHQVPSGSLYLIYENTTWEVWGHRIFVAFAPPTDPNGTVLLDRRSTTVNVTLEGPATTAVLTWNGVNQTLSSALGGTVWSQTVSGLGNGVYRYRVWATNATGTFASEIRTLTVLVGVWSVFPTAPYGFTPSLATDSAGNLHLCYFAGNGGGLAGLVYALHNITGWHYTEIQTGLGSTGQDCSIALDLSGHPQISFMDGPWYNGSYAVRRAAFDGLSWSIDTVSWGSFSPTAIAMNPVTGRPEVAYYDTSGGGLSVSAYDGTHWTAQTVNASFPGGYFSFAIDSIGHERIAYEDYVTSTLVYAAWTGSTWVRTKVAVLAYAPSLALNATGQPRIAYVDPDGLKYAAYVGSTWSNVTVDAKRFSAVSLALDAQGHPHIAYGPGPQNQVRYAVLNGTWSIQPASYGGASNGLALVLLPDGAAGIVFGSSVSYGTLAYATNQNLSGSPPVAALTASARTVPVGTPVQFNSTAHGPGGWGLVSELWDFGDGSTSTAVAAQQNHTYNTTGTYTVTLTVTDAWNQSAVASLSVTVTPVQPLALVDYDSPRGYVMPVPSAWLRVYNVTHGNATYELLLEGTVSGLPANLIVDAENFSGVQETNAFLTDSVQQTLADVQLQLPDAYLAQPIRLLSLSGHLAATFEIGYTAHPLVQLVLLVAVQSVQRMITAILTGPTSRFLVLNATFAAMLQGFRITVSTGPPPGIFVLAQVLGAALVIAVPVAALALYLHRRKVRSARGSATVTCASCGGPLLPGERFCGHCGSPTSGTPPGQGPP